ncbi:FYDLN acid domain-containing protein [Emcibacter nanhaiensis]|uniref:TIGR02300 family protein n=1 Tax=Emcibacter nanhaiensis TaxID=1505037 RepID=A0A501PNI7_9PROT|nr:FYDLN acid domain-containing protein [Emcibacter nanhaiensis]TPD61855.1 TIGR02300 family protein [Emcibacter nanhaiensis]
MAKPEWGTKRQCPKCGTRFYDLGNDDPIMCISCDHKFKPEIILKSKQHAMEIIPSASSKKDEEDDDVLLDDDDLLEDDDDVDVDLDEDDNTTILSDEDDTNVSDVVDAPVKKGDDD